MKIIMNWKDPISALTHLIGLILCIPFVVMLIYEAQKRAAIWHIVSFAVFGTALLLLYAASTLYHMLPLSEKYSTIFKRIDHMMIFVLIAGTYTPVCLVSLHGFWGWTLFCIVWGFAAAGIIFKIFWINAAPWISAAIYVAMGWVALIVFLPLIRAVPVGGIILVLAGGLTYTVGAVVYSIKWPSIKKKLFGSHELFHLFVMGGSFFHILFMFKYVLVSA